MIIRRNIGRVQSNETLISVSFEGSINGNFAVRTVDIPVNRYVNAV